MSLILKIIKTKLHKKEEIFYEILIYQKLLYYILLANDFMENYS